MDLSKWRVVPCETTDRMFHAFHAGHAHQDGSFDEAYEAMLAVAPTTDAPTLIDPAELAALRRDAARYRWLRHGDNDELVMRSYGDKGGARPFDPKIDGCWLPRNDELDRAIDAALAANGEKKS